MKVNEVLSRTTEHFKKKGIETARLDAELLLSHALKWQRIQLYSQFEYPLNDEELSLCREVVRRRGEGEPVAYIVGHKGFYNSDFLVTPQVLIPRPETECLLEEALKGYSQEGNWQIIDLGSGSGCLGLSLLKELPQSQLLAVDISEGALEVARKNAEQLQVQERAQWLLSDVAQAELPKADLIVANPPYIDFADERVEESVRKFEPAMALFAEQKGLAQVFAWTLKAVAVLKPEGRFFCEFGQGQEEEIKSFFTRNGISASLTFHKDLAGHHRFFEVRNG